MFLAYKTERRYSAYHSVVIETSDKQWLYLLFKDPRNFSGCSRDVKARETLEKLLLLRNYKMIMSSKGRITTP